MIVCTIHTVSTHKDMIKQQMSVTCTALPGTKQVIVTSRSRVAQGHGQI